MDTHSTPSKLRILVVEDIHPMRLMIRQMLRNMGITNVLEANDGSSALQVLAENGVDLILSDWNMVPMTGLQLLMTVRDRPGMAETPFIMITGEQSLEHVKRAREWGVNGYMLKPFGQDTLRRQIAKVMGGALSAA